MKSVTLRAMVLALISLTLVCAPQVAAQKNTTNPIPVSVVNLPKGPVPTRVEGTANVNVTNNPLPVAGNVNITNTEVPVSISNTPLPVTGTVGIAPDTTQYQYLTILAQPCELPPFTYDYCLQNSQTPIEQELTTLSSQGYNLVFMTESSGGSPFPQVFLVYTLRAPVTGGHRRAAPAH